MFIFEKVGRLNMNVPFFFFRGPDTFGGFLISLAFVSQHGIENFVGYLAHI
jgi:hypothetical protein